MLAARCRVSLPFAGAASSTSSRNGRARAVSVRCNATEQASSRRELLLASVNVGVLGAMFSFGSTPRPNGLGVRDYGAGVKSLALCPPTPNCVSTAEEANDPTHFVPGWTYNPEDGRGKKNPASQEQAMQELVEVLTNLKPDKFEPTIVKQTADYVYVEYTSPTVGFVDDLEIWFSGKGSEVEYRSASRVGESDFNINRKRIRAIRKELEKKGWVSLGF